MYGAAGFSIFQAMRSLGPVQFRGYPSLNRSFRDAGFAGLWRNLPSILAFLVFFRSSMIDFSIRKAFLSIHSSLRSWEDALFTSFIFPFRMVCLFTCSICMSVPLKSTCRSSCWRFSPACSAGFSRPGRRPGHGWIFSDVLRAGLSFYTGRYIAGQVNIFWLVKYTVCRGLPAASPKDRYSHKLWMPVRVYRALRRIPHVLVQAQDRFPDRWKSYYLFHTVAPPYFQVIVTRNNKYKVG